jgi:hypothetical protein
MVRLVLLIASVLSISLYWNSPSTARLVEPIDSATGATVLGGASCDAPDYGMFTYSCPAAQKVCGGEVHLCEDQTMTYAVVVFGGPDHDTADQPQNMECIVCGGTATCTSASHNSRIQASNCK